MNSGNMSKSPSASNDDVNNPERPLVRRKSSMPERYFWDDSKHGPQLSIVDGQPDVVRRGVAKQHTDGARGKVGYSSGRHTFKFTFNDRPWGSHCAIGVCTQHTRLSAKGYQHLFGTDAMSWAWDIPSGCLLHNGETKQIFKDKITTKVIYMTIDMNRGTLYFQPKDMDRFQAFSGLRDGGKDLLYPAVSLVYGMAEVRISLKHSSMPEDREKKKLAKKSSKSKEKRDSKHIIVEHKYSKENENIRKRSSMKTRETDSASDNKNKRNVHVTFENEHSKDHASEKGDEETSVDVRVVATEGHDGSDTLANAEVSSRVTDPVLTAYQEPHQDQLAPVDEPRPLDTSTEETAATKATHAPISDGDNEGEGSQSDEITETKNGNDAQEQNDSDKDLDAKLEAPAPAQEDKTQSDSRLNSFENENNTDLAIEDDQQSRTSQSSGSDSDRPYDTHQEPGNATTRPTADTACSDTEQETEPAQKLYLKKKITREHESDGTFHTEPISERQRTEIMDEREENVEAEQGIPEAVTYLPRRTTVEMEETAVPAAIANYKQKREPSIVSYKQEEVALQELEEPSDAKYRHVDSLSPAEQYDLQTVHGWDLHAKGGGIQLYPNVPYICIPIPTYHGRVQSVRCKRGFSSGIHKWLIRELPFYSPGLALAEDPQDTRSGLHIGAVSEEYRWFNQGFNMHDQGRSTWSWDSASHMVMQAGRAINPDDSVHSDDIDLQEGITVTLNRYKHTLTLTCGSKVIAEIKHIRGSQIYPYVLFNHRGFYPVEIKYLEGPAEYVDGILDEVQTKDGKQREASRNYQGLTREISTRISLVSVESGITSAPYDWGAMSQGLKTGWSNSLSLGHKNNARNVHYIAIADKALRGGRHKIEFQSDNLRHFVIGLVSDDFDQHQVSSHGPHANNTSCACPTLLGSSSSAWGWQIGTSSLYHAGRYIGQYPSKDIEVNWEEYNRVRMVADFGHNGYNIVSFRALNEHNHVIELGIAFVSLPHHIWPSVAFLPDEAENHLKISMDYIAGPKDYVTDMKSGACAIL